MRMTFSTRKQKFPSVKAVVLGNSVKNLYPTYISLRRYHFVVKVIQNGRREVKSSLVRK